MKFFIKMTIYALALIGLILVAGYLAVKFGFTNTKGIIDNQREYFQDEMSSSDTWRKTEEWNVLKEAILKDRDSLDKASLDSGIKARMIVAPLVVEQLRLYHSEREIFKSIFAPLRILGNQSQFSWGVMGIKQETARQIERNMKNDENILEFTTDNSDKERFTRLTDEKDRYYSYLYAGLMMKQIQTQWAKAGFPIENRPDIIATLFNIGFENSNPHANPLSGGSRIEISGIEYSFGSLAKSFYDSQELREEFPI
ncbi:MAG: hypothetical protein Q8Q03_00910 [bacterium]|nr:hypothetical protein [bacterium]